VDRFTVVAHNLKDVDADSPRWITHDSFGVDFWRLGRFQLKTRIRDRHKIFAVGEPIVLAMPKP
jgi:hypothetical protein